jgi:hypothetical protein
LLKLKFNGYSRSGFRRGGRFGFHDEDFCDGRDVRVNQMATFGASVGKAHDHMDVYVGLTVAQRNIANERGHLALLVDGCFLERPPLGRIAPPERSGDEAA